jgi:hypothetical protein
MHLPNNLKRLFFSILVLILQPTNSYADSLLQGLSGKIGINFAKWARTGDVPSIFDRAYKPGPIAGASLHLRNWEPVSPQLEFLFASRGSEVEIEGRSQGKFDLQYISLMLLARAELPIAPVILFAVTGPEVDILLNTTFTNPDGVTDDRTGFRRIDVGVVAGAGVAFGPFSWGTMTLEARYAMGFINVDAEREDVSLTNRTISFMLGYEYRRARDRSTLPEGKH